MKILKGEQNGFETTKYAKIKIPKNIITIALTKSVQKGNHNKALIFSCSCLHKH